MNKKTTQNEFLQVFNSFVKEDEEQYTANEIKEAFNRGTYITSSIRTTQLYNIFFENITPNDKNYFCDAFNINKRRIKNIYLKSSYPKIKKIAKPWDNKFRIVVKDRKYIYHSQDNEKRKDAIISRGDDKYTNLDKFKTYELTPCIAYEMAMRNEDVIKLLQKIKIVTKMMSEEKYLNKRFFTEYNFKDRFEENFIQLLDEYKDFTFEEYLRRVMKKHSTYSKLIKEDPKEFIDKHIHKCTELGMAHLEDLKTRLENELINEYLIYPTGYYRKVPGVKSVYKEEVTNSKKDKDKKIIDKNTDNGAWEIRFEEIIHEEFIQVQEIHIKNEEYYVNNIIPNFSRQINDQNQITIPINFSLPEEEIFEYIRKVKKKINPKTPLDLLEIKLYKKTADLTNMNTTNSKNIVMKKMTKGENPQYNLINMLYIYDMIRLDFNESDIKSSISNYYDNLNSKYIDINQAKEKQKIKFKFLLNDNRTIKEYYEIAKEYIEHKRYLELITGKPA